MKFEQSFDVAAPLERVWKALIDVEYVAPCLPGAAISGRDEEGGYRGTFTIKLGPTTAAYNGVLRIGEIDEANHRATLHARGTDKRGQGGATATIVNTVSEAGPGVTRVHADTDFAITGRLARFGRAGMMQDISNRLLEDFARCLQEKLGADGADAEAPSPAVDQAEEVTVALAAVPEAAAAAPEAEAAVGEPPGVQEAPPTAPDEESVPEPVAERTGSMAPPSGPSQPTASPQPTPAARSAAPAPAKPVNGLALFFSVLWRRLKARFSGGRKAP
jgi:carbon monoxide dehydrogenase subunit G